MNIKDLVSYVSELWSRHSPTVIGHIVLGVALFGYVLHPAAAVVAGSVWSAFKAGITATSAEVGIQIDLWIVLTALGYAYLNAFQWLAGLVGELPGLRTRSIWRLQPDHAARLARLVRLDLADRDFEAQVWRHWSEAQNKHFAKSSSGNTWYTRKISLWIRYLGMSALALLIAAVWKVAGAPEAVSPSRANDLLLGLLAIVLISRLKTRTWNARRHAGEVHDAIAEYEKQLAPSAESDEIVQLRAGFMGTAVQYQLSRLNHPIEAVRRVIGSLPIPFPSKTWIWRLLPASTVDWRGEDWPIFDSAVRRLDEELRRPPKSLSVEPFRRQFENLLECHGSGLFLVVPADTGLAPSIPGYGEVYCFAERRHGGRTLAIRLSRSYDDPSLRQISFDCSRQNSYAFFADAGKHAIETLVQNGFSRQRPESENWWQLLNDRINFERIAKESYLNADQVYQAGYVTRVFGVPVTERVDVVPGHSYVLRAGSRTRDLHVVVAFQCFDVAQDERMLVAWKLVSVLGRQSQPPKVAAWWTVEGWSEFWRRW